MPNSHIGPAFRSRAYAIAERRVRVRLEEGFDTILLTGETGTGKTRLLSALAAELSVDRPVLRLARARSDAAEVLTRWRETEVRGALDAVVFIDDADSLSVELQLTVRSGGGPRVQLVLAAKGAAYGRFADVAQQLDEAMACCTLGRLDDDEVPDYVAHRLAAIGADRAHFTREALAHVALCAQGVPRLVNLICAKACFVAGMNNEARVSAASVEEAAFVLRLGNISVDRVSEESAAILSAA